MRGVVALSLLILCAPTAGAVWVDGVLQGVSTRDATLTASEVVLLVGRESAGAGPPTLDLRADRIDATLIIRKNEVAIDEVVSYSIENGKEWQNETWHDVAVTGTERRAQYRITVAGAGAADLSSRRLTVAGHGTEAVQEHRIFTHQKAPLEFEVAPLHALTEDGGHLDLTGDFVISLWEWDVRLTNATAQQDHWTGQRHYDTVPGTPAQNDEKRRLYLQVTNGTLSLPLTDLEVTDLFVAGSLLDAASAVLDVAGQETNVVLEGPLRLGLEPVRDGVFLGNVLEETPEGVPPVAPGQRGEAPASPAVTATTGGSTTWTTGLALFALAVAALLAWRALRVVRLRRAMRGGDYHAVAGGAGMEASRRFGPEVVVARTVSMVKTGEYAAAAALLERHGDRLATAVRAYLWACVHAGRGEVDEAREAVVRSLLSDPGMAVEVEANRSLRRFMDDAGPGGYS